MALPAPIYEDDDDEDIPANNYANPFEDQKSNNPPPPPPNLSTFPPSPKQQSPPPMWGDPSDGGSASSIGNTSNPISPVYSETNEIGDMDIKARSVPPPPPNSTIQLQNAASQPQIPPPPTASSPDILMNVNITTPPPPPMNGTMSMDRAQTQPNLMKNRQRNRMVASTPPTTISSHIVMDLPNQKRSSRKNKNGIDHKKDKLNIVSFTDILRQVDVGIEMTDHLKEVVRKFCKHQQMGADKLQEIYGKLPSNYQKLDGMKQFANLCDLVHQLILETVSAQKTLADFLSKDIVPKMDSYIKDRQQQIQQLKKDHHQAETKLINSQNAMKKSANVAKQSALKAKSAVVPKRRNTKDDKNGFTFKKLKKKMKKGGSNSQLSEEEQLYAKAQQNQSKYEAAVMAVNYEQDTYYDIQARFKRDCKAIEQQRMQYVMNNISQVVHSHRQYFNTESIMVIQTRILSALETLNTQSEVDNFLQKVIDDKGEWDRNGNIDAKQFDYHNVFHSLQDSMDITKKLAPHAKLPLMLTTLCNKVRELNGFDTEGIFRKSASATEIDNLKVQLSSNNYTVNTTNPHVPAGLLKDWLRGLNDSLIPQSHYDMCISMAKTNVINSEALEVFLSQLPEVNRETIKYLVKFLNDLLQEKHQSKTKMNLENVSIVFAPTILKCPSDDPQVLFANTKLEKTFVMAMLTQLNC